MAEPIVVVTGHTIDAAFLTRMVELHPTTFVATPLSM